VTVTELTPHSAGFDLTPPHDLGAEQRTLGGMLQSKDAIGDVARFLRASQHYRPLHQEIHGAIMHLHDQGDPADVVTVLDLLRKRKVKLDDPTYLHTLIASVPTAANAGYYARIVRDHWILRELIRAGTQLVQAAHSSDGEPAELAERARQVIDAAAAPLTESGLRSMDDLMVDVTGSLETEAERGLPTGFADLDALITGLAPGELTLVAARPSVGKSLLVTGFAAHAAIDHGHPVLMVSLEMSAEEITTRLISSYARVPLYSLVHRQLTSRDWDAISRVYAKISSSPLRIDDSSHATLAHIRSRLREMARSEPAELLVVDYLGLLTGQKAENRQAEVAALSRGLKLIAREFSIPVVAAAQLNRGPEQRHDHRPMSSDLRESGAQEQDADVIILLHREDAYDRETPRAGEIDFIVDKNRQGPKATITAAFQGHYARIVDMAPE